MGRCPGLDPYAGLGTSNKDVLHEPNTPHRPSNGGLLRGYSVNLGLQLRGIEMLRLRHVRASSLRKSQSAHRHVLTDVRPKASQVVLRDRLERPGLSQADEALVDTKQIHAGLGVGLHTDDMERLDGRKIDDLDDLILGLEL